MGRLKACPFCGGGDLSENSRYVVCNDCSAQGPKMMHGQVEQWNRRVGKTCRIVSMSR